MSETKTYIVPDGNNSVFGGNDGLAALALMSNGGGFGGNGMWNNPLTKNVTIF